MKKEGVRNRERETKRAIEREKRPYIITRESPITALGNVRPINHGDWVKKRDMPWVACFFAICPSRIPITLSLTRSKDSP